MSKASRVIKNSGYLYIKMGVSMFASLYSTRLILASLGESDFGIFNVVGGAIAMLGFLNATMANATQRFMSYAEGEGQIEKKKTIFNVSLVLHVATAASTVVILLIAMFPLFNGIFNIEPDRFLAAKAVYYCLIFSTVLTIINVPYDAVMNAHENMFFYSIIGIIESLLRLSVAFVCVYTIYDKLIVYGILSAIIPLLTLSYMKIYCHRHYEECVISPRRYWDGSMVKQITGFFGWNFLTAISSLFSIQGVSVVLNNFFGTILNAAQGVAGQVSGALSTFSSNMMKALNPVITKDAGAGNMTSMNRSILAGCKFSALLTMFFGIPVSIEIKYILGIWLTDVPEWTAIFVVLQFAQSIIIQMGSSAATAVYAQGDIKNYAIWKSIMNIMPIVLSWLAFRLGGGPIWLYIPMIAFWGVAGDIVIIHFAKKKCELKIIDYYREVILPILGTSAFMLLCGGLPMFFLNSGIVRLLMTCLATTTGMFISVWLFALSSTEKIMIGDIITSIILKIRN